MTFNERIIATIRTAVPSGIGALLAYLVALVPAVADGIAWIDENLAGVLGGSTQLLLSAAAVAGVTALYYWAVRKLSVRWPNLELLLGSRKTPDSYSPATKGA